MERVVGQPAAVAPLLPGVAGPLRAQAVLSSVAEALAEVVANSLDAGASDVHCELRLDKQLCFEVRDNGHGISAASMPLLGQRFASSKAQAISGRDGAAPTLGYRGEALAALCQSAAAVEVTSRAAGSFETHSVMLRPGQAARVGLALEQRIRRGTVVAVRDLFCSQPVRHKALLATGLLREAERCREAVLRLALLRPQVTFTLYDRGRQAFLLKLVKGRSELDSMAGFLGQPVPQIATLQPLSGAVYGISGYAALPPNGHLNATRQCVLLNGRWVKAAPIARLVDGLFQQCYKPNMRLQQGQGEERQRVHKAVNARASFVLQVSCPQGAYELSHEAEGDLVQFQSWQPVLAAVRHSLLSAWQLVLPNTLLRELEQLEGEGPDVAAPAAAPGGSGHAQPSQQAGSFQDWLQEQQAEADVASLACDAQGCGSSGSRAAQQGIATLPADMDPVCGGRTGSRTKGSGSARQLSGAKHSLVSRLVRYNPATAVAATAGQKQQALAVSDSGGSQTAGRGQTDKHGSGTSSKRSRHDLQNLAPSGGSWRQQGLNAGWLPPGEQPWQVAGMGMPAAAVLASLGTLRQSHQSPPAFRQPPQQQMWLQEGQTAAWGYQRHAVCAASLAQAGEQLELPGGVAGIAGGQPSASAVCRLPADSEEEFRQLIDSWGPPPPQQQQRLLEGYAQPGQHGVGEHHDPLPGHWQPLHPRIQRRSGFPGEAGGARAAAEDGEGMEGRGQPGGGSSSAWQWQQDCWEQQHDGAVRQERAASQALHRGRPAVTAEERVLLGRMQFTVPGDGLQGRSQSAPPHPRQRRHKPGEQPLGGAAGLPVSRRLTFGKLGGAGRGAEASEQNTMSPPQQPHQSRAQQPDTGSPRAAQQLGITAKLQGMPAGGSVPGVSRGDTAAAPGAGRPGERGPAQPGLLSAAEQPLPSFLQPQSGLEVIMAWRRQADSGHAAAACSGWQSAAESSSGPGILTLEALSSAAFAQLKPACLTRQHLSGARALLQVDSKFIPLISGSLLVLVDQHAADERVQLERLRDQLLGADRQTHQAGSHPLRAPLLLGLTDAEQQLLEAFDARVAAWGWRWQHSKSGPLLTHVPLLWGTTLTATDLKLYLHHLQDTCGAGGLPVGVVRVLNSKACRGAIMFGDSLEHAQCQELLDKLAATQQCFSCAHGRPTTVPLVDLRLMRRAVQLRAQAVMGAAGGSGMAVETSPRRGLEGLRTKLKQLVQ